MEERARLVQGEFFVYSEPVQGTEISVFVPFVKAT
jgi:signal transduction histidine kinase